MPDPQEIPRCLTADAPFRHKREILAALAGGAALRKEERSVPAESHFGIYSIRLGLARDTRLTKGYESEAKSAAEDFEFFLAQLKRDLTAVTQAWHLRCANGERFTLIENETTGELLGCLHGRAPS